MLRPPPYSDDLTGASVGSYRIVRKVGEGGMSTVWLGELPAVGSTVAIKVPKSGLTEVERVTERFHTEARALRRVSSRQVVKLFDFDQMPGGRRYAVMELLRGETLDCRLQRDGPFSWQQGQAIALQVARAVMHTHEAGVVHRDIKPENLFLVYDDRGVVVKLIDFGIAKLLDDDQRSRRMTKPGYAIGTPAYCAPEQLAGRHTAASADIFSLGSVLHHMFSGQPPFGWTLDGVLEAKLHSSEAEPPGTASVPEPIDRLIRSMLSPTAAARPVAMDVCQTIACHTDVRMTETHPTLSAPLVEPMMGSRFRATTVPDGELVAGANIGPNSLAYGAAGVTFFTTKRAVARPPSRVGRRAVAALFVLLLAVFLVAATGMGRGQDPAAVPSSVTRSARPQEGRIDEARPRECRLDQVWLQEGGTFGRCLIEASTAVGPPRVP